MVSVAYERQLGGRSTNRYEAEFPIVDGGRSRRLPNPDGEEDHR